MESNDVTVDLAWLDDAFAKGFVDEFEAACCLAGYNKDNVRTDKAFRYYQKPSQILNTRVSKIYEIILTLTTVLTRKSPLFWFVEQAVINAIPHINYDLLLAECLKTEYRKKIIIRDYPDLAEKLGLASLTGKDADQDGEQLLEEVEAPWRKNALLIYRELKLDKSELSKEKKAKKVHEEMKKRFASGVKGMTKRGGKKVPDCDSIRRLVLNNL